MNEINYLVFLNTIANFFFKYFVTIFVFFLNHNYICKKLAIKKNFFKTNNLQIEASIKSNYYGSVCFCPSELFRKRESFQNELLDLKKKT